MPDAMYKVPYPIGISKMLIMEHYILYIVLHVLMFQELKVRFKSKYQ